MIRVFRVAHSFTKWCQSLESRARREASKLKTAPTLPNKISFIMSLKPSAAFFTFDRLVQIEYKSHRQDWESDNRPNGVFWVPEENRVLSGRLVRWGSSVASRRCALIWLFSTPKWTLRDSSARRGLFWWRLLVGIWGATFVAAITLLVFGHT